MNSLAYYIPPYFVAPSSSEVSSLQSVTRLTRRPTPSPTLALGSAVVLVPAEIPRDRHTRSHGGAISLNRDVLRLQSVTLYLDLHMIAVSILVLVTFSIDISPPPFT
jgi:hypothetical protein